MMRGVTMDTREHVDNQLIEILESLANKAKSRALSNQIENNSNLNNESTKENNNVISFPNRNIRIPEKLNNELQETQKPDNPKSLKNLLAAQQNLQGMRNRLNDNPEKNKAEILKLDALEKKLNHSILVAKKRENELAIKVIRSDSRIQILKVGQQLDKIKQMRDQMEKSPRFYKEQLQKLDKLESKLVGKVEKFQAKTLQSALRHIVSNPAKYRQEINRYDELKSSLKVNQKENENELKVSNDKNNSMNKTQEKVNQNENKKENELSRSSSRSRDDLELTR